MDVRIVHTHTHAYILYNAVAVGGKYIVRVEFIISFFSHNIGRNLFFSIILFE